MDVVDHGPLAAQLRNAARLALHQWTTSVGSNGYAAMLRHPGLVAAVDQHAAQIRDAIADRHGIVGVERLAAYADGVLDGAAAHGWTVPEARRVDWPHASWPLVRLLAICVLAKNAR